MRFLLDQVDPGVVVFLVMFEVCNIVIGWREDLYCKISMFGLSIMVSARQQIQRCDIQIA